MSYPHGLEGPVPSCRRHFMYQLCYFMSCETSTSCTDHRWFGMFVVAKEEEMVSLVVKDYKNLSLLYLARLSIFLLSGLDLNLCRGDMITSLIRCEAIDPWEVSWRRSNTRYKRGPGRRGCTCTHCTLSQVMCGGTTIQVLRGCVILEG